MATQVLKIPKKRIGVVIGKKGSTKEKIEKLLGVKLEIKGSKGEIKISSQDPVNLLNAKNIIKAIGRGFNPEKALKLLKKDVSIRIVNLSNYAGSKKDIRRLKGRVIGSGGKARKTIENITNTLISVYGKTISIIGRPQNILMAWKAIDMLLRGRKHQTVYIYLKENEDNRSF